MFLDPLSRRAAKPASLFRALVQYCGPGRCQGIRVAGWNREPRLSDIEVLTDKIEVVS